MRVIASSCGSTKHAAVPGPRQVQELVDPGLGVVGRDARSPRETARARAAGSLWRTWQHARTAIAAGAHGIAGALDHAEQLVDVAIADRDPSAACVAVSEPQAEDVRVNRELRLRTFQRRARGDRVVEVPGARAQGRGDFSRRDHSRRLSVDLRRTAGNGRRGHTRGLSLAVEVAKVPFRRKLNHPSPDTAGEQCTQVTPPARSRPPRCAGG